MAIPAQALGELLEPLRENNVTALLRAQARALDAGAEIEAEPIRRDPQGHVRREGALGLPERGDLTVTLDGHTVIQRVRATFCGAFDPCEVFASQDFTAVVTPFYWDRAALRMSPDLRQPDWTPLRHWFLEWFQPRHGALAPELTETVHRLDGPGRNPLGWRASADLGSAPVEVVAALIAAVAQSGCASLSIGSPNESGRGTR